MNLTSRARILLTLSLMASVAGVVLRQEPMALAGLSVVVWIGLEWLGFRGRTLNLEPAFSESRRHIDGQSRGSHVLVVDRPARVEVDLRASKQLRGLRCWLEDALPAGLRIVDGSPALAADIAGEEPLRWSYTFRPRAVCKLTLPGLQWIVGDQHGLFTLRRFVPLRQEITVLPFMVRPQATVSVLKQQNVQVLPGVHRHRKAGFSTELLGIRDYQFGDPPRSIAWKATARLDRLMTCEYESEAPIRATIFADLSPSQFVGRPGPARADRIIAASAAVARLLLSDGDPVAAMTAAGKERSWLLHGLGERHLARLMLRWLSLGGWISLDDWRLNDVTQLAYACGVRRFPELFDDDINFTRLGWLRPTRRSRRLAHQRQQVSFVLAALYGGHAGLPALLQHDDRLYREYCERLLAEEPYGGEIVALPAEPAARRREEVEAAGAIARGLLTGVSRANDNELFAIVAPVPEQPAAADALLQSIRVAIAEHHRVLMIDVGHTEHSEPFDDADAERIAAAVRRRADQQFAEFERRLIRLGAKISRLEDPKLLEKVAAEIDLLRFGRARTGGAR